MMARWPAARVCGGRLVWSPEPATLPPPEASRPLRRALPPGGLGGAGADDRSGLGDPARRTLSARVCRRVSALPVAAVLVVAHPVSLAGHSFWSRFGVAGTQRLPGVISGGVGGTRHSSHRASAA